LHRVASGHKETSTTYSILQKKIRPKRARKTVSTTIANDHHSFLLSTLKCSYSHNNGIQIPLNLERTQASKENHPSKS
jgi:hypothetical protein